MARPASNLRMFVAAYPPPEFAQRALDMLREIELPPHRLTPVDQVHLTLQFIGDVPSKDLEGVIESVERSAAGLEAFTLTPSRLRRLPERGPARLVALETDAPPALLELHRRLVTRLARQAKPRREDADRFLPHLTLCRFNAPVADLDVDRDAPLDPWPVTSVSLMRSTLAPQRASHRQVAAFQLKPA